MGVYHDANQTRSGPGERIKMSKLTVRLSEREALDLQRTCMQTGKTQSEVVRALLAESLPSSRLRQSLKAAHKNMGPTARQSGWLTEDDILKDAI